MNEADNCEGIMVLETLILSVGASFDQNTWVEILNILEKRFELKPITEDFLKANIYATLALVAIGAQNIIGSELINRILSNIFANLNCFSNFTVSYANKVLLVALCNMIISPQPVFTTQISAIINGTMMVL